MEISTATIADVPQLNRLVNSAYRGETSKKGWTTEADLLDGIRTTEESLSDMINDRGALILKLVEEDTIQGCVYLKKDDESLYLGMLTIQPDLQAKGLGKRLLFASEEQAEQWGCNRIYMRVITDRAELIEWYERHGYERTNATEPFESIGAFGIPKKQLEFVILEKTIK